MDVENTPTVSRRTALKHLSLLVCAVPVSVLTMADMSAAQKKMGKAQANYKDQPSGEQKCGNCMHFRPDETACTLVEGDISPQGWCKLWTGK